MMTTITERLSKDEINFLKQHYVYSRIIHRENGEIYAIKALEHRKVFLGNNADEVRRINPAMGQSLKYENTKMIPMKCPNGRKIWITRDGDWFQFLGDHMMRRVCEPDEANYAYSHGGSAYRSACETIATGNDR